MFEEVNEKSTLIHRKAFIRTPSHRFEDGGVSLLTPSALFVAASAAVCVTFDFKARKTRESLYAVGETLAQSPVLRAL